MACILITAMSGAGKSTLLGELAARGRFTVDPDDAGWEVKGLWDEPRMSELLAGHKDVVVSGTVENSSKFYNLFDCVILLSAPVETLIEQVSHRTNNPYGRTREQQEEIRST